MIADRLQQALVRLQEPQFLSQDYKGNELHFHIFDYDPRDEAVVAGFIQHRLCKALDANAEIPYLYVHLFQAMQDLLQRRNYAEKVLQLEQQKGSAALRKGLGSLLSAEKMAEEIFGRLEPEHRLVLMSGVGSAWPFVMTHHLLNNLHARLDKQPLVVFYPGSYDGRTMRLFNRFQDDHYYRAFQLVPHSAASLP